MHSLGLFLFFRKLITWNVFSDGCYCKSCQRCYLTRLGALFCTNTRSHIWKTKSTLEGGNRLLVSVWWPAGLGGSAAAQRPHEDVAGAVGEACTAGEGRIKRCYLQNGLSKYYLMAHLGVAFPQYWLALLYLAYPLLIPSFLARSGTLSPSKPTSVPWTWRFGFWLLGLLLCPGLGPPEKEWKEFRPVVHSVVVV